jgi:hypothetical protein
MLLAIVDVVKDLKEEIGLAIVGAALCAVQEIRLRYLKPKTSPEHAESLENLTQELSSLRKLVQDTFAAHNAEITRMSALVESMSVRLKVWQILSKDCVFESDGSANLTLISEPLCAILGMSETSARGKGWLLGVESSKRHSVWEKWEESVASGLPYDEIIPLIGRDRAVKRYRFFALPQLHPETKKVILYLGTVELVREEPSSHNDI